jgi:hypothetical protein
MLRPYLVRILLLLSPQNIRRMPFRRLARKKMLSQPVRRLLLQCPQAFRVILSTPQVRRKILLCPQIFRKILGIQQVKN